MSTVTVFVDDAVQGQLPMVGATDGAPADGLHRIHRSIGGSSGWAWLLVFFGPIGWVVLIAVLAFGGSAREFVVRLPYTHQALDRERTMFRAAVTAGGVLVGAVIVWFVTVAGSTPRSNVRETIMVLAGAVAIGAAVLTAVLGVRYTLNRPAIELDASGRWVMLRRVHPAFADACAATARRRVDGDRRSSTST